MPELPEVETVIRSLRPHIIGHKIQTITVLHHKTAHLSQDELVSGAAQQANQLLFAAQGQTIQAVIRLGKYIILQLNTGYLVAHLRMTGKIFPLTPAEFANPAAAAPLQHVRVIFALEPALKLVFVDQRKFGRIIYCANLDWLTAKLGPDPLGPAFTVAWLQQRLAPLKRAAKPVLLDQSVIAGLGNIYVDEALWYAGVLPTRPVNQITKPELERLHAGIQQILTLAIQKNGTTFQSYSFMGEQPGEFVSYLQVFGRQGLPCYRCGTVIKKIRVAQRGTHVCFGCQK
ncbi:MAG TPA: DNA-formamidopyrimidine glycosylase [Candidatus Babeliales bacterium]|nr:DNA-formamidopyrimidine glycosylase [Candidatus Babeliales bacterium]